MRNALFLLPLLLSLTAACGTHGFVNGTAIYGSTPPLDDHAGAVPVRALVCVAPDHHPAPRAVAIRLGQDCHLFAAVMNLPNLTVDGTCSLPTAAGTVPITVQTAVAEFQFRGNGLDVTVGGTTKDGHYLTYKFTGAIGANDGADECNELQRAPN